MKIEKSLVVTGDDGHTRVLSPAVMMAVRFMLEDIPGRGPALITAIKFVRLSLGIGLKDAKDIVDYLRESPHLMD